MLFETQVAFAKACSDTLIGVAELAATGFGLAMAGPKSTLALLGGSGDSSRGAVRRTAEAVGVPGSGGDPGVGASSVDRWWSNEASRPLRASSSTGRSWYRAPYRSPFDAMFWLEPSAQVSARHPVLGDALPGGYQPDVATNWALMLPFKMLEAMPGWGEVVLDRTVVDQSSARQRASANVCGADWPGVAAWKPLVELWGGQFATWSQPRRREPLAEAVAEMASATDVNSLYSAYRNASGHAVAQIVIGSWAASSNAMASGAAHSQHRQAPAGRLPGAGAAAAAGAVDQFDIGRWQRDMAQQWMRLWMPRSV